MDFNATDDVGMEWGCRIEGGEHNRVWTVEIYLRIVALLLVVLFSSIGNGTLVLSVVKQEKLRTVTNVLVISQCLSDLALTVICAAPRLGTAICRSWCLGCHYCILYDTFTRSFVTISMVHLAILSLDRFLLIVRRINTRWITKRTIYLLIPIVWLSSLVFYEPWLATRDNNRAQFELQGDMCFFRYTSNENRSSTIVSSVMFSLGWLLPLFVQLYCFHAIIQDLRTCKRKVRPLFSSTWYQIAARAYAKSAYTILYVIALFVILSAPFSLMLFLRYVKADVPYFAYTYTELLMFVSIAVKPYVYIARSKHCRNPLTACIRTKPQLSLPVVVRQLSLQKVRPLYPRRKTLPYVVGKEESLQNEQRPVRNPNFYSIFSAKAAKKGTAVD